MNPRNHQLLAAAIMAAQAITPGCVAGGSAPLKPAAQVLIAWLRTRDGSDVEGTVVAEALGFSVDGTTRAIPLRELLSFHSADPASAFEQKCITADLAVLAGSDLKACEAAAAELADIGLPVLTPLLRSYQDVDAREPDPRYRLFGRILPGYADACDRALDLVRLASGEVLRGKLTTTDIKMTVASGEQTTIPAAAIRRLAIRRASTSRSFDLQALHHCTYVGFLDTGIGVTKSSMLRADSAGYVRLSFDEDGWASVPDGIEEVLPGKRRLQEGFRWGAVLGRVGPAGERWFAGNHVEKNDMASGRLYFVVNDNEHWQNNIGSYRVHLTVTNAYDLGDPQ